jgi:hypothetical protein
MLTAPSIFCNFEYKHGFRFTHKQPALSELAMHGSRDGFTSDNNQPRKCSPVIFWSWPFSMESYGRLGQPAMVLLHRFGDEAAWPAGVSRASFVAGALRDL